MCENYVPRSFEEYEEINDVISIMEKFELLDKQIRDKFGVPEEQDRRLLSRSLYEQQPKQTLWQWIKNIFNHN